MGRRNKSTSHKFNKYEEKPLSRNQLISLRRKEQEEIRKGNYPTSKTTPKTTDNKDYDDSDGSDTDTDTDTNTTTTTVIELSLGEILFWKVWRNIVLRTKILSIVSTRDNATGFQHLGVYKYNDIVSVQWLLKYGYIELLKLKVRNNDHLMDFYEILNLDSTRYTYNQENDQIDTQPTTHNAANTTTTTTTTANTSTTDRYSIFKLIQDDNEFYENLYENYSEYFIKIPQQIQNVYNFPTYSRNVLKIKDYRNEFEYSLMESLKHDNISSYAILDRNFNYNYGVDGLQSKFYEAINHGSIKVAKYLYRKLKIPKNEICSKVWKDCTFFKSLLGQEDHKHFKLLNKIVKFLIVDLKLIPPKEMKIAQDIFEIDIKSITVGELHETCYTIAMLLENTQFFSDYIKLVKKGEIIEKYQGFPDAVENYLPNPSLDFLKVEQLKEILSNIQKQEQQLDDFVYQQVKPNLDVYKLVKMVMPFSSYSKSYKDNFIFYSCKYLNDYSLIGKSFNPLLFGQMKTILEFQTSNLPTLFKYCENEEVIQNQFINSIIQNIKTNIDNERQLKMKPHILIKLLLDIDRLDLIEIVIDKLLNESDGKIKSSSLIPLDIIKSIKSIKTFDYFMSNNQLSEIINKSFTLANCLNSNDQYGLNLMNHIKANHPLFYKGLLSSIDINVIVPINYSLESLLFIYNNINDFQHCYERVEIWTRIGHWNFTLDQFIQLVNGTPYNRNYTFLNSNDILEITLSQLHWIKSNRPSDLISKRCIPEFGTQSSNALSIYDYFSGNFNSKVIDQLILNSDQVSPVPSNKNYFRIIANSVYGGSTGYDQKGGLYLKMIHYIAKKGDTKSLDSLMKLFNLDDNLSMANLNRNNNLNQFYSGFITPLLKTATINGRLSVFYFIKIKYAWVFSCKSEADQDQNRAHYYLISSLFSSIMEVATIKNYIEFLFLLKTLFFKEFLSLKL